MPRAADRLRNVALVGHRGSGKTALHEALLFQAGAISRLGRVPEGSTTADADPEEHVRQMSISTAHHALEWKGRKINLLDTPGEPSFVAEPLAAMRVCESAIFVVDAVMGVEAGTERLWARAAGLDLARMVCVNMLDRERADFFSTLEALKTAFGPHVVATEIPIGVERDVRGVIDLVDMRAYETTGEGREDTREIAIPEELVPVAQAYRERLMDEVAEVSEALMERYLEGDEIGHDEVVAALKEGTNHGGIFPVVCSVATRNLGTERLLDAIVEDLPSPVKHGGLALTDGTLAPDPDAPLLAYVFRTRADRFAGRINLFRVYQGVLRRDMQLVNPRTHAKERIGHLEQQDYGPGDIGAVGKLKDTHAGDWLAARDEPVAMPPLDLPAPVMAFAVTPTNAGDDEKLFAALRRLQEEDPTLDVHRDPQTGERIVAGLSEVHVEVVVGRLRSRFGVEVDLRPPRVPYRETIRCAARGHGRHKKQSGGRGQFGDCSIAIEPLADGGSFEFVDASKGGVIPHGFVPAVEKGCLEAMARGVVAGFPVKGVRVTLHDGAYHRVDSSEMAFKAAGALAMRLALAEADPVVLEPIMLVTLRVPEVAVGDVMGDLAARRGRPLGTEPSGPTTVVRAEVPMAELLSYAPDLRSMTGGQGDFTMEFAHHAEVPAKLVSTLVTA
jgi:elongation factor G